MRNLEQDLDIQRLIDLLNSDATDSDTGVKILQSLERGYNVFGDYSKISEYIYDNLTDAGKGRFLSVWCMAGFELAFGYLREGKDPWDERKKASMRFAYENLEAIRDMFVDKNNLLVEFNALDTKNASFPERFRYIVWGREGKRVIGSEYEWLYGFSQKFVSTHSTIKQSFYGGTCNGVIAKHFEKDFYDKKHRESYMFPFV